MWFFFNSEWYTFKQRKTKSSFTLLIRWWLKSTIVGRACLFLNRGRGGGSSKIRTTVPWNSSYVRILHLKNVRSRKKKHDKIRNKIHKLHSALCKLFAESYGKRPSTNYHKFCLQKSSFGQVLQVQIFS